MIASAVPQFVESVTGYIREEIWPLLKRVPATDEGVADVILLARITARLRDDYQGHWETVPKGYYC